MESNSVFNHRSDQQNRMTAKRESDLSIMSMITDRIGRHEVLLPPHGCQTRGKRLPETPTRLKSSGGWRNASIAAHITPLPWKKKLENTNQLPNIDVEIVCSWLCKGLQYKLYQYPNSSTITNISDPGSYEHYWTSSWIRPEKNSGTGLKFFQVLFQLLVQ